MPGLTKTTPALTVHETITLGSTLSGGKNVLSYLPLPYAPRSVTVPGDWRVERNSLSIYTTTTALAGLRYTVTSADVEPSPQQLRDAPAPPASERGYLTVPQPFERLRPLATRVTAGQSTAYGKAVALQQWFTEPGNFKYALTPALPPNASALVTFLTKTRRGYCQQFAFAMAVMARLVGIPSRVVVGYTQGVYQGNGTWQVRTSDAHAWPELYFAGAGWLRFEPTPTGSPGQAGQPTASAPAYSFPPAGSTAPAPQPTSSALSPGTLPSAAPGARKAVPKLGGVGGSGGAQNRPTSAPLSAALVAIVVLGVAAVTPFAVRSFTRRRRWFRAAGDAGRAHAAWLEFRDDLTDHRIASRASESPRALAGRLGASLGFTAAEREALERIALAEERARYARAPVASAQLHGDVATVRRAMAQGVPPARQVRRRSPARIRPGSGADGDDARARRVRLDGCGQQRAAPARRAGRPLPAGLRGRAYRSPSWRRRQRSSSRSMNPVPPARPRRSLRDARPRRWLRAPPRAAARARGAPGDGTAHVTPARQRPHGAGEHDHEAADTHKDDLGNHTGQQQAHSEQEPDRGIDHPPLVVDLRVSCAHGLRKLRIVGIERLLDLLELTLLVLRKRHSASHEPHARGQVR